MWRLPQKHTLRMAVLLDEMHARIYRYTADSPPILSNLQIALPRRVRRISEDFETRHVQSDRQEHIRSFFRSLAKHLEGANEIQLCGPGIAKDEFAHVLESIRAFKRVPIHRETKDWITEPEFERWAREKLRVPLDTLGIFLKGSPDVRVEIQGPPGAEFTPAKHARTNEPKPRGRHGRLGATRSRRKSADTDRGA